MGEMADYYNDMIDDIYDMGEQEDEPPYMIACPKCGAWPLYEYWERGIMYMIDKDMLVHDCRK